jgi:hypothetical protein
MFVHRKSVKLSADLASLSISKDAGVISKTTSMFLKEIGPTLDMFGSRSALGIQKIHSSLTDVDI